MAQREEVHARLHPQRRVRDEQGCGLDEPVGAHTAREADVVSDGHVVESRLGDAGAERLELAAMRLDVLLAQDDPYAELTHDMTLVCVRHALLQLA